MCLQFCLKLYNQTSETIPKKLFLNSKIIWICIYSLNITMYLIWFSSFEETQRKSIVLLWDESTWLMRIIVGWKYGKIEGRELTGCTLYYILIHTPSKFFTTTTETSQNSSKWSHYSTNHKKSIDLCIRPL